MAPSTDAKGPPYKGVKQRFCLKASGFRYSAECRHQGTRYSLGTHDSAQEAAVQYDLAVLAFSGRGTTKTNFAVEQYSDGEITAFKQRLKPATPAVKGSKCRGVGLWQGKWDAFITVQQHTVRLGRFDCEVTAAQQYDLSQLVLADYIVQACTKLNFPEHWCAMPVQQLRVLAAGVRLKLQAALLQPQGGDTLAAAVSEHEAEQQPQHEQKHHTQHHHQQQQQQQQQHHTRLHRQQQGEQVRQEQAEQQGHHCSRDASHNQKHPNLAGELQQHAAGCDVSGGSPGVGNAQPAAKRKKAAASAAGVEAGDGCSLRLAAAAPCSAAAAAAAAIAVHAAKQLATAAAVTHAEQQQQQHATRRDQQHAQMQQQPLQRRPVEQVGTGDNHVNFVPQRQGAAEAGEGRSLKTAAAAPCIAVAADAAGGVAAVKQLRTVDVAVAPPEQQQGHGQQQHDLPKQKRQKKSTIARQLHQEPAAEVCNASRHSPTAATDDGSTLPLSTASGDGVGEAKQQLAAATAAATAAEQHLERARAGKRYAAEWGSLQHSSAAKTAVRAAKQQLLAAQLEQETAQQHLKQARKQRKAARKQQASQAAQPAAPATSSINQPDSTAAAAAPAAPPLACRAAPAAATAAFPLQAATVAAAEQVVGHIRKKKRKKAQHQQQQQHEADGGAGELVQQAAMKSNNKSRTRTQQQQGHSQQQDVLEQACPPLLQLEERDAAADEAAQMEQQLPGAVPAAATVHDAASRRMLTSAYELAAALLKAGASRAEVMEVLQPALRNMS